MIDFIKDEQKIETKKSSFLKLEDGCHLQILSNLISFSTFYNKENKQVILWAQGVNEKRRQELYYWAKVNDQEGVLRLPMSVFLSMNETERLLKKDKKNFIWIIGKKGQGLETRYNVIKGEEVKITDDEIKKNNEKLKKIIEPYYQKIKERLDEYLGKKKEINYDEKINPEDIPF